MKKIFISSDHAGYKLKEQIKKYLKTKKVICFDLGPSSNKKVDYPIYAHKLAKRVKTSKKNVVKRFQEIYACHGGPQGNK